MITRKFRKWIKRRRKGLNRQSPIENKMKDHLRMHGVNFKRNWPLELMPGKVVFLDFYFPQSDLIVELDGPEHKKKDDLIRDRNVLEALTFCKVIRFRNKQIKKNIESVIEMVLPQVEKDIEYLEPEYPAEFMLQDAHLRQVAMYG